MINKKTVREPLASEKGIEGKLQLARLCGFYQLQAANVNREAVIRSAKIGARARYFQGCATLISAIGVFGTFGYKMYEETKHFKIQAQKLATLIEKHNTTLKELADLNVVKEQLEKVNKTPRSKTD